MITIKTEICDLCGTCLSICPEKCIEIIHFALKIDHSLCINCNKCIMLCPLKALENK